MRVELGPAFVLHTRSYTDSRLLVELFTADYGRLGAVARTGGASAASGKKSSRLTVLRPFQPLLVSWQGRSDLKTVTHAEADGAPVGLAGTGLYCGMYLNELLLRVTAVGDAQTGLFRLYQDALRALAQGGAIEPVLRGFELELLAELGYGVPFDVDALTAMPLTSDSHYTFDSATGFIPAPETSPRAFRGSDLQAMAQLDFSQPEVRQAAKRLCRMALQPLLGDRPLKSRELFR